MEIWVVFILAGLIAGFLAGLLGIGGGFVVVPVLIFALPLADISNEHTAHFAIGTSLLCICVTAMASTKAHHARKAVDWQLFKIITPGLILGAILGATFAATLSSKILIILFVSGAIITAIYLLLEHTPTPAPVQSRWAFVNYGIFTGAVSSLIGIGGGSVLVPYLVYKGKPMVQSVATAAACGFPIALFGASGYAISGWQQNDINQYAYASGYLYWPAFLGIVIFSSLAAPFGAKIAHLISERRLKQVFAIFLFLTSAQILYSQWF